MERPRLIACAYAAILIGVTVLGWIPQFADETGRLFGIFRLTWYNDLLHLASASWAIAAARGTRPSIQFLRWFGTLYLTDGLLGLASGSGYLDLGIVICGIQDLPFTFKIFANFPHIALGGLAILAGFGPTGRPSHQGDVPA